MEITYLKQKPLFEDRKSNFHVKVTKHQALDISDDAINVITFDNDAERLKYIFNLITHEGSLAYLESTKKEFDEAFINVVTNINDISKL